MNRIYLWIAGLLLIFQVKGCTSVKRFRSATFKGQDNTLVQLDLFRTQLSGEAGESVSRDLWDLSASAQTQYIQILDQRYPENSQFMASLGRDYEQEGKSETVDFTKKNLRLVFTVHKIRSYPRLNDARARFSPADRVEFLSFSITVPEDYNLAFREWNRFATEYGELEIADVSFSGNLTVEKDLALPGISEANMKSSLGRTEEQEIRSRYLKLNGRLNERSFIIEEEGTRETDLTGNVEIDVSLVFEGYPERITIPVFAETEAMPTRGSGLVRLDHREVTVPRMENAPDTLKATLSFEYVYRHVQSGWKTFGEWDDRVEYYTGFRTRDVPLFLKKDYIPLIYTITGGRSGEEPVKIRWGEGEDYLLQFLAYQDASRFLEWLSGNEPLPANIHLSSGGMELDPDHRESMRFKLVPVY